MTEFLGQSPESAGNEDYARIGFRYYSANYAAIVPIIPPFFKKKGRLFLEIDNREIAKLPHRAMTEQRTRAHTSRCAAL